jgi:hypothetical protein
MKNAKEKENIYSDKRAFRREVRLARVQVEGLSREELAMVLAYEIEPYSSIPASEASVEWREIESQEEGMRVFDVALLRKREKKNGAFDVERLIKPLSFIAVVLLAAMACDYFHIRKNIASIEKSLTRRMPLQADLMRLDNKISAINRQAQDIRIKRESVEKAQKECALLRSAYCDFLSSLSVIGARAIVRKIEKGKEDFSLSFVLAALDEKVGSEALSDLTDDMSKKGWEIQVADMVSTGGAIVEIKATARFIR